MGLLALMRQKVRGLSRSNLSNRRAIEIALLQDQNKVLAADLATAKGLIERLIPSPDQKLIDAALSPEQQEIERKIADVEVMLKVASEAPAIVTKGRERRRRDVERWRKELEGLRAERRYTELPSLD